MAIIKKYLAKVEEIKNQVEDIFTISFSSQKRFQYLPGQFLHLALDEYDPSMLWPESRCFSMQSNPSSEHLKITFTLKGNFTERMVTNLYYGKEIWLKLPYGNMFNRGHSLENCVFIAGGTGITPFLSLFTDESFILYNKPKLYFGLRSKNYNIFQDELNYSSKINKDFEKKIIYQDKEGVLNIHNIYMCNPNAFFFISGPPQMISKFRNYLLERKIPETKIITDDWE